MRILLVEDDVPLAKTIKAGLKKSWVVDWVDTCAAAKLQLACTDYFLVLLDVQLPDGTGWELCNYWRQNHIAIPFIFLTGLASVPDKVRGFNLGADDYLTKPFSLAELEVRIQAQARRSSFFQTETRSIQNVLFDSETHTIALGEKTLPLRQKEWQIMELLAKRKNHIVSHYQLWEQVWEQSDLVNPNTVEVHISRLRKKLKMLTSQLSIKTVKPVGYQLVTEGL